MKDQYFPSNVKHGEHFKSMCVQMIYMASFDVIIFSKPSSCNIYLIKEKEIETRHAIGRFITALMGAGLQDDSTTCLGNARGVFLLSSLSRRVSHLAEFMASAGSETDGKRMNLPSPGAVSIHLLEDTRSITHKC